MDYEPIVQLDIEEASQEGTGATQEDAGSGGPVWVGCAESCKS